jgi:hypothetical protein
VGLLSGVADSAERIVYRVAGLPVALASLITSSATDETEPLLSTFSWSFWHPDGPSDWAELLVGIAVSPVAVLLASAWYIWRNGSVVRRRSGKGVAVQFAEHLKLYLSAGVLPPWYYIFSLHDDGARRAKTFIHRFETKRCFFPLLKPRKGTPLNDKSRFAEYCRERGIRCVPTLMYLNGKAPSGELPNCDIFVKPSNGRGGRGAERWDLVAPSVYASPSGERLSGQDLLCRLQSRSQRRPLLIQPRLLTHPNLAEITSGALPTLRVLTCLDEDNQPEVIAAMIRTSFGKNKTVDNLHAGGIGALVDLHSGALSKSSNLGSDARLGWFSDHPDTGATIDGRIVPYWNEAKHLAAAAHQHFDDRVVVGWDIAIVRDGPIFIEGNGNPDLDILQRFMPTGFRTHRFAQLLIHHLHHQELAVR